MEVTRLEAELKFVEINGCTLSIDERMRIDIGCQELANQINASNLYFWGKIRGKQLKQHSIIFSYHRHGQGLYRGLLVEGAYRN